MAKTERTGRGARWLPQFERRPVGLRRNGFRDRLTRPGLLPVAVTVLVLSSLTLGLTSAGYPAAQLDLHSGQVWLGSTAVDQVALVDGSTGDLVTQVRVPGLDESSNVVQAGRDAVVGDGEGGLLRVDAATWRATPLPVRLPTGAPVRVLVGPHEVHVVSASGEHLRLDPATLRLLATDRSGRAVRLDAVTVDARDRLWALTDDGSLLRLGGKHPLVRRGVAGPGATISAGSTGVLVADPGQRRVLAVGTDGETVSTGCLSSSAPVLVAGAADGRTVVAVSGVDGRLVVTDLDDGTCAASIRLTPGSADFGMPVLAGKRAFVPDRRSGRVHVVDLVGRQVVASPAVLPAGSPGLVLVGRDGVVFFNDEHGQRAGIVRLDGSFTEVTKYKGKNSGEDDASDGGGNPEPTPRPDRSEQSSPARPGLKVRIGEVPPVAGRATGLSVASADQTPLTSAIWAFDDGSAAAGGLALTHVWAVPGIYRLRVRADGQTWTGSVTVVAPSGATPTATAAPNPTTTPKVLSTGTIPTKGPLNTGRDTQPTVNPTVKPTVTPSRSPETVVLSLAVVGQGSVQAQPSPAAGSNPCTGECELSYPAGSRVTLRAVEVGGLGGRPGMAFGSWSGACAGVQDCEIVLTESQSVTATFAERLISVEVAITGAGQVTSEPAGLSCTGGQCSGQFSAGTSLVLTATPDSGARLVGWGGGCTGTGPSCALTAPTTDQAATVSFEALPQLRITVGGGGSVVGDVPCSSSCSKTFDPGATVTLTARPDWNATFQNWDGDCSGTGDCTLTMTQDRSVTVGFRTIPAAAEDCIGYNPNDLSIKDEGGSWLLTDGRSRMLVLDDETDANDALALARGRTAQCFVGRPNSEMDYWAGAPGGAPDVARPDCIRYDPADLSIRPANGKWRLVEGGDHWMALFETEADAGRGLSIAHAHTRECFIGRTDPPAETWYWLP